MTKPRPMTPTDIKKARQRRFLTQSQFGELLGGYSQTDVSHWEKGITTIPKAVKTLLALQENRKTKCFLNCVRHTIPEPFAINLTTENDQHTELTEEIDDNKDNFNQNEAF